MLDAMQKALHAQDRKIEWKDILYHRRGVQETD